MNVRKEVQLIIEHSIRSRVNQVSWNPCATSTPLNTLGKFDSLIGYNQRGVVPRNTYFETASKKTGEVPNSENTSSRKNKKRSKTRSRNSSFGDDYDDETDDNDQHENGPKDNETRKSLIIKLGSDQFDNNRIKNRRSAPILAKEDLNLESKSKEPNELIKRRVKCKSTNNKFMPKQKNSNIKECSPSEKRNGDSKDFCGSKITKVNKKTVSNVSCANNNVQNESGSLLASPENMSSNENEIGNALRKRNKGSAQNGVVCKKIKHELMVQISPLKSINDHASGKEIIENVPNSDKNMKESKTKLSTSHEIFSENKEQEYRDSLDLTAVESQDSDEKFKSDHCENIQVFHANQKNSSKKKISNSRNNFKCISTPPIKIHASNERPKRARKSPRDFWLLKSLENEIHKDTDLEVNEKVNEVDKSKVSVIQKDTSSEKVTTNEHGSDNSSTSKDFFKNMTKMDFTDIPPNGNDKEAYSYALGWNFPTFKCGALKIGKKCETSGRTKHEDSHFGGVILEGRLSMKIQEEEMELSSGEMFCVPPLTDWKAINKTKKNCILYYWCGRFSKT